MPRKGQTMLFRQVPRGFPEKFVEVGWGGIEAAYHAHAKTIKRWLVICGYDALRTLRAQHVAEHGRQKKNGGG